MKDLGDLKDVKDGVPHGVGGYLSLRQRLIHRGSAAKSPRVGRQFIEAVLAVLGVLSPAACS